MLLLDGLGSLSLPLTLSSLVPRTSVQVRQGPIESLRECSLMWVESFPAGPNTGMCITVEWPPRF